MSGQLKSHGGVLTPDRFFADKTGLTNSTAALFNFYTQAIINGSGHIPDGTYLITEGVLAFDNGYVSKNFPIITTGQNVIFKAAGTNDAPILSFTNGTADNIIGQYWTGGSHGQIHFLDETTDIAPNRHGINLRGIYKTRFDNIAGTGLKGDVVHLERKLYQTSNPDPYAVVFCNFKGLEGSNCVGWTLNNDNYVGFNGCTVEYITCADGVLGAWRGFGAGTSVSRMAVGNCSGWALDDGLDKLGGNSSRLKIGSCEFDNVENILRLTHLSEFDIGTIRIIHKYNKLPNIATNYWPRNAFDIGSVAGGTIYNGKIRVVHRFDPGGVLTDIGTIINGNNSVNIATMTIDNTISDNGALGVSSSNLITNIATLVQGLMVRNMDYKVYDSNVRVGGAVSMSAAVSIPVSGFGTANAKIPYTSELYDRGNRFDATNNWFLVPLTGTYRFDAAITLVSPVGTHIRLAAAYDRGGTVGGLGYRSYYSPNAAASSYEINLGFCSLQAGDKVFFMAAQDTAAPIALSVTLSVMDNFWSCYLLDTD